MYYRLESTKVRIAYLNDHMYDMTMCIMSLNATQNPLTKILDRIVNFPSTLLLKISFILILIFLDLGDHPRLSHGYSST